MRCTGDLGRVVTGFGFHDVVIESPVHSVQLQDLEPREVGEVLLACKKRIEQIKEYDLIKYVQVLFFFSFKPSIRFQFNYCYYYHFCLLSRYVCSLIAQ